MFDVAVAWCLFITDLVNQLQRLNMISILLQIILMCFLSTTCEDTECFEVTSQSFTYSSLTVYCVLHSLPLWKYPGIPRPAIIVFILFMSPVARTFCLKGLHVLCRCSATYLQVRKRREGNCREKEDTSERVWLLHTCDGNILFFKSQMIINIFGADIVISVSIKTFCL